MLHTVLRFNQLGFLLNPKVATTNCSYLLLSRLIPAAIVTTALESNPKSREYFQVKNVWLDERALYSRPIVVYAQGAPDPLKSG